MTSNRSGRKNGHAAERIEAQVNEAAVAAASQDANDLAMNQKRIAADYGDGLEYDRVRVVHETRMFMSASSEAMLEAGKRLIVLRENELHGDFTAIVEGQLGIPSRTARQMMQATVRYMNPAFLAKRQAPAVLALGKTKLFELMAEPEEALLNFADGGTVAGLKVDRIDAMTTRELKEALRKAENARKSEAQTSADLISQEKAKVTELQVALGRRQSAEPNEAEAAQLDELRDAAMQASLGLMRVVAVVDAVSTSPATEAADLAARQTLDFVAQRFTDACSARGLSVEVCGELVQPRFLQPINEALAQARKNG